MHGSLLLPVLELHALVEIDVAVLRRRGIVVVLPGIVVLVDDRRIEARRSACPVEGILAVVAPRSVAGNVDRERPKVGNGLVVGEPGLPAVITVIRYVEQVARDGCRGIRQEGLRKLAAVSIVVRQGIVPGEGDAAARVAAQLLEAKTECRTVRELA